MGSTGGESECGRIKCPFRLVVLGPVGISRKGKCPYWITSPIPTDRRRDRSSPRNLNTRVLINNSKEGRERVGLEMARLMSPPLDSSSFLGKGMNMKMNRIIKYNKGRRAINAGALITATKY